MSINILYSSFSEKVFLEAIKEKKARGDLSTPEKFSFLCGESTGGREITKKFRKEYFFFFEKGCLFTCDSIKKENLKKRFFYSSLPEEVKKILGVG